MIEKIKVNSRTGEIHGTTLLLGIAYYQSAFIKDAILLEIFTRLIAKNDELGVAIDRSNAQSILAEKDDVRDDALRAVGYLIQGYLYYPEETVRNAAKLVKEVFDKYGFSVTREGYVSESSHIVSMLGDFAAPNVAAAIALLRGVGENITILKAAEDDFVATSVQFAQDEAEEATLASATVLKKQVVTIINDDLVQFLRYSERFQNDTYGAFARTVAKLIADNNEQVKKRGKKGE